MDRPRRAAVAMGFAAGIALTVTGCASASSPARATGAEAATAPLRSVSPTQLSSAPSVAAVSTVVPRHVSQLPAGVYRTQLTEAFLNKLQADGSDAGTWTLIVNAGTYRLECRPISDPGYDCGNHDPSQPATVEVGTLHGTGMTVWFVHDLARLVKITRCVPDSQASTGCGPQGGYRVNWKLTAHSIAFSDFVGLGDEAGEPALNEKTARPWTRISS